MQKNHLPLTILILVIVVFAACTKSTTSASVQREIMFINGCTTAGSDNLDVSVNNAIVASSIPFMSTSGNYLDIPGTTASASFLKSGTSVVLVAGSVSSSVSGGHFSAFAGGSVTAPFFSFSTDDLTPPPAGRAKIRFVNLSPDSLQLNCFFADTLIDANLNISSVASETNITDFYKVGTSPARLLMQDKTDPTRQAFIQSQAFTAGHLYTVMFTGTANGTGTAGYALAVIMNY